MLAPPHPLFCQQEKACVYHYTEKKEKKETGSDDG
jgi:hypothetical protein